MKVDVEVSGESIAAVRDEAVQLERIGVDGLVFVETRHDPFLPVLLAAEHTSRVTLRTGVAVAFARSPMTVALVAHDLQRLSGGRFVLGLGTQVRAHIERRYSMPWSRPVARIREFVEALRAIWSTWDLGVPLDFRGEHYRHTLMSPVFSPPPNPHGPPAVGLAAVGEHMTELAGEVADGLILHGFTSPRYVAQVTLPALARGLGAAERARPDVEVAGTVFVATGADEPQRDHALAEIRQRLAFYASTLAYRPVLETHGWGHLQDQLHAASRRGEWEEMGRLLPDEVVDAFAVVDEPERVGPRIRERFGGLLDRIRTTTPYPLAPEASDALLAGLTAGAVG